ncbi:hypothetical protein FHW16_002026 [Phyllobacterium myrsinacearum]|uniref:Uncharacterized protein n=1 Tax=Phyllobacterium myrsinacearum TaxID=28101 RepID=A0A839ELF8_9HYPH|nr:hypothetical protein [Phyllobacterium myrsinacearum]
MSKSVIVDISAATITGAEDVMMAGGVIVIILAMVGGEGTIIEQAR